MRPAPTDVLLRLEEGGGFVAPSFLATQAPIFTLYGDGTIVFRNPMKEGPPPVGDVYRLNPFRTARLSEDQIQATLERAIGEGGLGAARPEYENNMVADASTAIFTVNAGGLAEDGLRLRAGDGRSDIGGCARSGGVPEAGGLARRFRPRRDDPEPALRADRIPRHPARRRTGAPNARKWPWPELRPSDFVAPADPNSFQLPVRVLTAAEVAALGVDQAEGGLQGATLIGPDGKFYAFSLRPLLPGESS